MLKIITRILIGVLCVLLLVILLVAIFSPGWTRRNAEASYPQIEGEIVLDSLNGKVEIYRDPMGVPHIYAATQHDLFFAQ